MNLSTADLDAIRTVVRDEASSILTRKLQPLEGRLSALENDIKEIYAMLSRIERAFFTDKSTQELSVERRLLKLNRDLLATAKEAGVTLPR